VVVGQVRADHNDGLRPAPQAREDRSHAGEVMVASQERHHARARENPLHERQVHFQAVLAGVSGIVVPNQPVLEQGFDGVAIHRHRAQRRVEGRGMAGRDAGKGHPMRRAQQDHALDAFGVGNQAGVGAARDGA
jgi:hypothetical protein